MRLCSVRVKEYKNLKDFNCVFSDSNITAFIGNNGSGKSNLLELITRAFSNAKNYSSSRELSIIPPGSLPTVQECIIQYEIDGVSYELDYNTDVEGMLARLNAEPPVIVREEVSVRREGKKLSKKEMGLALPKSVLLYYAGETQRQKGIAAETYDSYYEGILKRATTAFLPCLRFMDYFSIGDLPLLLLAAAAYKGDYYSKFMNLIECSGISPHYSFVLKNAYNSKGSPDTYWNATGFVRRFLDEARKYVSKTRDTGGSQYYMYFDDAEDLKNISEDEFDLFAKLKVLRHYGYLEYVGIELQKNDGSAFSCLRLSEGEKQLGLLLLLTSFTARHECLYLFDEFDAYLHLNWQREFGRMLKEVNISGHLVFTTHSPATISGMVKKSVHIMNEGKAAPAPSETYNRSLDEIMEEHMLVSLRPYEYNKLVQEFRNAVIHGEKKSAEETLLKLREICGETDPFFITARIALNRME